MSCSQSTGRTESQGLRELAVDDAPGCSCHEFPPGLYMSPLSQPVRVTTSSGRSADFEELKPGCTGDAGRFSQSQRETALGGGGGVGSRGSPGIKGRAQR